MQPDIRYARNGDVAIAYQVVGDGERDLILVPDYISNLVYYWESPYLRDLYERLARSFRLILFDKRGTGLSDRGGAGWAALETRMADMRAILDAAGSERAVVFGSQEGGQMAALYAATYPESTEALVLFQFAAYETGGGSGSPYWQRAREDLRRWGTQELADQMMAESCPTLLRSETDRVWFANCLRVGASPEIGLALNLAFADSDLREVLPSIRVPTLLLSRGELARPDSEDAVRRIHGARLVQLAGSDYAELFLSPEIVDEVEAFVATLGAPNEPESVLATILFTDLVGSATGAGASSSSGAGASSSSGTMRSSGASSRAIGEPSSTPPATASSPASTGRHGRFAARARSATRSRSSGSSSEPVSTRASASCSTARLRASRSRSAPASRLARNPARCSSPRPCATSLPARGSPSRTEASQS